MSITDIIGLLSGVALFLFGMTLMGEGLKHVSGNKLEPVLSAGWARSPGSHPF